MEQSLHSKLLSDTAELQRRIIACLTKTKATASVVPNSSSGGFMERPMASHTGPKPLEPNAPLIKPMVSDATYTEYGELNAGSSRNASRRTLIRLSDQRLYMSIREIDLDKLFKNTPKVLECASIRNPVIYQGSFYGEWSVKVMRRIQDKFNFSVGNIRWMMSILRSSGLPFDVPLLKRDVTKELAEQIEQAIIDELLGHTLCVGNSSVDSTSFQTFSYDPKSLQNEVLNNDFTVVDHSTAAFRYYPDSLSPPPSLEVRGSQHSGHPLEYCPEKPLSSDQCDSRIPEKHFGEDYERGPRSRSCSPFSLVHYQISQVSGHRDEGRGPPERSPASRDQYLGRDAAEVPDLECSPDFAQSEVTRVVRLEAEKQSGPTHISGLPEEMKRTQDVNCADAETPELAPVLNMPDDLKNRLAKVMSFMETHQYGPYYDSIIETPNWREILQEAVRDDHFYSVIIAGANMDCGGVPVVTSAMKIWHYLADVRNSRIISNNDPGEKTILESSFKKPLTTKQTFVFDENVEIEITWNDPLAETLERFTPKTADACFDLAGFFMECFNRMPPNFQSNLNYVTFILNKCTKSQDFHLAKPTFFAESKIWQCCISASGKWISGYGRSQSTAVLNALGSVCPEKIPNLRRFARNQGLIGWKFARKFHSPFSNAKLNHAFLTELNNRFYLSQTTVAYCQNGSQMVYDNLQKAVSSALDHGSLMVTSGSVCVDVAVVHKDGDRAEKTCIGTHFSTGSACLTLICSFFSPSELMKFLDDLMLLLGGGSLKQDSANQVAVDFYWDLLLARIDFLEEICQARNNLLKSYFNEKYLVRRANILECLVTDDAFYYCLLGWILEEKLKENSYFYNRFLRMWSVAESRCDRVASLSSVIFKQISNSCNDMATEDRQLITSLTEGIADPKIFISKVCQSSYLYQTLMSLLSGKLQGQMEICAMEYACRARDSISISPYHHYANLHPEVILGNPTRALLYQNVDSITGLIFELIKFQEHVTVIDSICRDHANCELVKVINDHMSSLHPRRYRSLIETAAKDILYPLAVEQWQERCSSVFEMQQYKDQKAWHVGFWQAVAVDTTKMPNLKSSQKILKLVRRQGKVPPKKSA